jgi:hypothetical protein
LAEQKNRTRKAIHQNPSEFLRLVRTEGSATKQNGVRDFEIPKISPRFQDFTDFKWDFKISSGISRFHARFQDFK